MPGGRGRRRKGWVAAAGIGGLVGLSACTVGPDYVKPDAAVPAAYKEAWKPAPVENGWRPARPADGVDRGAWWSVFHDPVLDGLERQIDISNQNLKAAEAAFRQAEASVAAARAQFFPTATIDANASRSRGSGGGGGGVVTSAGTVVGGGGGGGRISNQFSLTANASWVPDLWGSVRRTVEGNIANAQASAATLANVRLAAQGALATAYMELRTADELARLLSQEVKIFSESLKIVTSQYRGGTADQSAVDQARAQLEATRAQLIAVQVTRGQLEHSIAVLIGKPPAELSIPPTDRVLAVPVIPAELPAALLERRPDIAAAERDMQAANAQIGVDVAAFYPTVTLSADYGVSAGMLRKLFTSASRIWSLGASAAETIFDAGARNAQVERDKAAYDAAVATYRQAVLSAFQQVEDQLLAQRVLADQAVAQDAAVKAARSAETTIFNQYRAGTQAYTAVIVAENTALGNAETALNIRQSRLVAAVALIEALGGGWDASQIPPPEKIESDMPLNFNPLPPVVTPPK